MGEAGEGYGKYEATPQKSVEGNKGLNYPPHPLWSLTLLGEISKLTQWRWYKVNSGKSKAVIFVGTLPSPPVPCGHPGSLLKQLHLHIWGLVIISWCRSLGARRPGQTLCLWAVTPSPQDLPALPQDACMEKWLLGCFCVCWGTRRNPKPHFSAPVNGGEIWKLNLCLQALWRVHGFSGSPRSTPVEFLERKDNGSHSDAMVSSPQESWGLKGFWIKSKGFGMKMEEKKSKHIVQKLYYYHYYCFIIIFMYQWSSLSMERNCLEFLGTWRDTGMMLAEFHALEWVLELVGHPILWNKWEILGAQFCVVAGYAPNLLLFCIWARPGFFLSFFFWEHNMVARKHNLT